MFKQRQPASSKNGSFVITIDAAQQGRLLHGSHVMPWTKLVLDLYPTGTSARYLVYNANQINYILLYFVWTYDNFVVPFHRDGGKR